MSDQDFIKMMRETYRGIAVKSGMNGRAFKARVLRVVGAQRGDESLIDYGARCISAARQVRVYRHEGRRRTEPHVRRGYRST